MPNWCLNEIEITGSEENIQKLKTDIQNFTNLPKEERKPHTGLFLTLIGLPDNVEEITDDNWYSLNVDWLGTKWDVFPQETFIEMDDSDRIYMSPDTAWSPPLNFCRELSKKYGVNIEHKYFEQGNDFSGRSVFNPDGTEENEEYTYMEGLFILKPEDFEYELENELEYLVDEIKSDEDQEITDELIQDKLWDNFGFLSESIIDDLTTRVKERL